MKRYDLLDWAGQGSLMYKAHHKSDLTALLAWG